MSVSDTGRRRRWTDAEKIRIVEASRRLGMTLAEVARRHEISRSVLYDWRYRHKLGLLGAPAAFIRLVAMDDVDLGDRYRITIPAGFYMETAARLLNGLVVGR